MRAVVDDATWEGMMQAGTAKLRARLKMFSVVFRHPRVPEPIVWVGSALSERDARSEAIELAFNNYVPADVVVEVSELPK